MHRFIIIILVSCILSTIEAQELPPKYSIYYKASLIDSKISITNYDDCTITLKRKNQSTYLKVIFSDMWIKTQIDNIAMQLIDSLSIIITPQSKKNHFTNINLAYYLVDTNMYNHNSHQINSVSVRLKTNCPDSDASITLWINHNDFDKLYWKKR